MEDELVITEENFDQYFFDVRRHSPERGQVLVCYTAMAELIDGMEKSNVVDLLATTFKAEACTQVMRKLFFACEVDSVKVPLQIVADLLSGMTIKEVMKKPYSYKVEIFYYTKKEHAPLKDPHWRVISLLNLEEHLERAELKKQEKKAGINVKTNQFAMADNLLK